MNENDFTSEEFENIYLELAGDTLSPSIAKLYSHYTRIKMKQPGLLGWRTDEFSERLEEAVTLIDIGLFEKEHGLANWRNALRRAGELLEWLSLPDLNDNQLPLRLLAAAVYQLAGYPALSLGLLNNEILDSNDSQMLTMLLKGDFPHLLSLNISYWTKERSLKNKQNDVEPDSIDSIINNRIVDEVVRALGIFCTYMRWGDAKRLSIAQKKLHDLSKLMIYGNDSYSWLLSKIVSEVVKEFVTNSLRSNVQYLLDGVSADGKKAFERYLRNNYRIQKSLAWYSQIKGIERLIKDESFTLCTPTGSGKTTIAELAIIQSMFLKIKEGSLNLLNVAPITMYLVPSRALATEVESKLGKVLGDLGSSSVRVTGLYGGIDWGPTDAWITSNDPTVLICTYEKAEALIRFLGPLFLNRVSLIVIDEVHSVQYNSINHEDLRSGDNRNLRLETLTNRLLRYTEGKRTIALSAVAEENEFLAKWISRNENAEPVISSYRSTRQLIGRLEWIQTGEYEMRFDILDGSDLLFNDTNGSENVPFIQRPFDPFPIPYKVIPKSFTNEKNGVSKRQRPHLFWAAMQLAQPDEQGNQHSVLISITQHIGGYAEDFLIVLNKVLKGIELPPFFIPPSETEHIKLFEKCLLACEDYFGIESNEYQLLLKGIAVHHGNMPGVMARLMVELLQKHIVHIALATSTLSEGVNLPFETVIVPTLTRGGDVIPLSEFKNLAGRAGRPGSGTEGRTLVFLETGTRVYSSLNARQNYDLLIDTMRKEQLMEVRSTLSPLGALIQHIADEWRKITGSNSLKELLNWLEKTIPCNSVNEEDLEPHYAEEALDSLDGYLLSVIVEQEEVTNQSLNLIELEEYLRDVWKKTYAWQVMQNKETWEKVFLKRGISIRENVYPDPEIRRRLYRTSVAPRFGKKIISEYHLVKAHLAIGFNYASWTSDEKINYIVEAVKVVGDLGKFKVKESVKRGKNAGKWDEVLTWWLHPIKVSKKPVKNEVSEWIKFVKGNFEYKFSWGLGTIMALILDDLNNGVLVETKIEDWPNTGLPWVVFWLKELITWGTLDPVAALLLAHGIEFTRKTAEAKAEEYYSSSDLSEEEILNPLKIKEWVDIYSRKDINILDFSIKPINANLTRDFSNANNRKWRVLPIILENNISWIDPAGYELATSDISLQWGNNMESRYDFILDVDTKMIDTSTFL
ncbi:hypothetical protein P40081_27260 [Paenibacillus sp. FSL P4-0081]|uniref:DEAD/DEAH box helicase n=1 Tax=Paenibacillus sp. FSL P4-0081 TaxID=1536769 RepID=UPI0004F92928|nr:DEAD/DEAH box helicase [Paenibacillus sp. FSL P4-0081]AIQ31447.1 hypothetical protein P40081_27260 [Paenibacillus sp. FSL P4-0081]